MELKVNDQLHGFTVTRIREMKDVGGTMVEMVHDKTGAELIFMDRDIENMTFSIAFKTLPDNDTGVFHILEHSVLNGSKKYPVREPFVDLLKGSMQTFLNAMTYPDKTMYPVASRNKKDFLNLMSVYLDAVFEPAIYTNPNIFYQEGWRYEIHNPEDEAKYNGVVFNEMKGAYSSVDEVMITEMNRMLFDNTYQYCSGGDPVHIPELTYEQFIETHQKFYHPSNARVFLDGPVDLDEVLKKIDEEYFGLKEKEDFDFSIPMQEEKPAAEKRVEYEINPGDPLVHRTQIVFGNIYGRFDEVDKMIAWQALSTLLTGNNEAPLKKAIIENGLGEDIELYTVDGIQQPYYAIIVQNTDAEKKDEIVNTIKKVINELLEQGLDHKKLCASLNQFEFKYREKYEPSGVMNADDALKSWLYGGDPALYLDCGELFGELRKKSEENYFENLLKDCLMDWNHMQTLIVEPSDTLGEKRVAIELRKLAEAKASWGDKLQEYIELNKKLEQWQQTPDTEEAKASLPRLALSDVEKEPRRFEPEMREIKHVPILFYPEVNKGITYLNAYISLAGIKLSELPMLGFYASLLQELPTKNKTVEDLQEEIRAQLGTLTFTTTSMAAENSIDKAQSYLVVNCSVLNDNVPTAIDLILEILQETVFDKELIRRISAQTVEEGRKAMVTMGHAIAIARCSAMITATGAAGEAFSGFTAMKWMDDFNQHFDERIDAFVDSLEIFQKVLNNRNRFTISVTGEEQLPEIERFITALPNEAFERCVIHYPLLPKEQNGIVIPASIAYEAMTANLGDYGIEYSGALRVLGQILTYDYLWNEVRVKGGAYGTGFIANVFNTVASYSYRDPNPQNTIQVQKNIANHLRSWLKEDHDLDTYIIGCLAQGDPLLAPGMMVKNADVRVLSGIDYNFRLKSYQDALNATKEELLSYVDALEKALEEAPTCVVATEEVLKEMGIKEEGILKL